MKTNHRWQHPMAIAALCALLSGCQIFGMAGTVRITGESFDEAECIARDFKGKDPCPTSKEPAEPAQHPN